MKRYDIFPVGALAVLGALEGKTVEEMAQSLLEQEEEIKKQKEKKEEKECSSKTDTKTRADQNN